jgi:hypothetical protein
VQLRLTLVRIDIIKSCFISYRPCLFFFGVMQITLSSLPVRTRSDSRESLKSAMELTMMSAESGPLLRRRELYECRMSAHHVLHTCTTFPDDPSMVTFRNVEADFCREFVVEHVKRFQDPRSRAADVD